MRMGKWSKIGVRWLTTLLYSLTLQLSPALPAIHCAALHCIAFCCHAFPCSAFHCLRSGVLRVIMLQSTILHRTVLHYTVLLSNVSCFLAQDMQCAVCHTVMLQGGSLQAYQDCLIMQVSRSLLHTAQDIAAGLFNHKFQQPYQADQHLLHLQKHVHLQWMGISLLSVPRLSGATWTDQRSLHGTVMQTVKQHLACAQKRLCCSK